MSSTLSRGIGAWIWALVLAFTWVRGPLAHLHGASVDPQTLGPVAPAKSFHGTIRARDLAVGTISLGRGDMISRVLVLDANSRLFRGLYPATLSQLAAGDFIEGYAFPDAYGRMVIAVATTQARPITSRETKAPKVRKSSSRRSAGGTGGAKSRGEPVHDPSTPPTPPPSAGGGRGAGHGPKPKLPEGTPTGTKKRPVSRSAPVAPVAHAK